LKKLLRKNSGYGFLNGQNWAVLENIPLSFNSILLSKKNMLFFINGQWPGIVWISLVC